MNDKELIELADKGLLSKDNQKRAMKLYVYSLLQKNYTIMQAYNQAAIKFSVDVSTIQRTLSNK